MNSSVTVLIPNYNHEAFLKQRIESVLNQTWQELEIIILDDRSSDNSRQIIESYRSHPKVKEIVYNETNSGSTFKQWQKGIELATGDWIWIAESDDWCEVNLLETLMKGVNTNTTLAVAQSVVVTDAGKILWESHAEYLSKNYTGETFIKNRLLLDNFGIPNASMCIFRKALYFNIDKEFTTYKFCGDWLFWILIARQGDVFVSGKYLNYFRKHDKDVSGPAFSAGLHYSEYFKLLDTLEERKIISEEEKYDTLVEKFKMFLKDDRLDQQAFTKTKRAFKTFIPAKFYPVLIRTKIILFLKNLNKAA